MFVMSYLLYLLTRMNCGNGKLCQAGLKHARQSSLFSRHVKDGSLYVSQYGLSIHHCIVYEPSSPLQIHIAENRNALGKSRTSLQIAFSNFQINTLSFGDARTIFFSKGNSGSSVNWFISLFIACDHRIHTRLPFSGEGVKHCRNVSASTSLYSSWPTTVF